MTKWVDSQLSMNRSSPSSASYPEINFSDMLVSKVPLVFAQACFLQSQDHLKNSPSAPDGDPVINEFASVF